MKLWLTALIGLLAAACGAAPPQTSVAQLAPATAPPPATSTLANSPTFEPTQPGPEAAKGNPEPESTATPAEVTDWLAVEGKTGDNLAYLGNPEAPVTLIDYSDFL